MKLKLIMLPNPIVVSDEEIKDGAYHFNGGSMISNSDIEWCHKHKYKKIIAGIPELPSIDFSALSDEDCKRIGWVDVEKLAEQYASKLYYPIGNSKSELNWVERNKELIKVGVIYGFKTAQSLNDKKFTEEDVKEAMLYAMNKGINLHGDTSPQGNDIIGDYIQSLSQPKVFDIEVEIGLMRVNSDGEEIGFADMTKPKITNNSIKITKIL